MRQTSEGKFEPIGWDEAYEIIGTRLTSVRARHGADAIAIYQGNPIIHNHGTLLLRAGFVRAVGTRNSFSAGSQDQWFEGLQVRFGFRCSVESV
jgi:anaerobic selenocysteine-containing dehydrogenase